ERYFKQAAEIDLQNNMGNAAGGVHAASCGGLWQAVTFGFAGMWATNECLAFDPWIPKKWGSLKFSVVWHGRIVQILITADPLMLEIELGGDEGSLPVRIADGELQTLEP